MQDRLMVRLQADQCLGVQGALLSSDMLLTVSPSYANEITQDPAAGFGLHDLMSTSNIRCASFMTPAPSPSMRHTFPNTPQTMA